MGFKTILVHVDTGRSAPARLKLSADLAARSAAHVTGLYVRRPFQAPAFTDAGPAMDSLYRTYENAAKADEALATAAFRDLIGGTSLSSEWRVTDGLAEEVVAAHARYADLVIVGQAEPDAAATTTPPDLAETVAMAGERPVLDRAPYRRDQAAGKDGDAVLERHPRSGAGGDRRAADPQEGRQGDHPAGRSQERWRLNSRARASPDGLPGTA